MMDEIKDAPRRLKWNGNREKIKKENDDFQIGIHEEPFTEDHEIDQKEDIVLHYYIWWWMINLVNEDTKTLE